MPFPSIIIFERHWDVIPKKVAKEILPKLAAKGYSVCLEAPQDLSMTELLARSRSQVTHSQSIFSESQALLKKRNLTLDGDMSYLDLVKIIHLLVSSKAPEYVAERIKHLPAELIYFEILTQARELSMEMKGVDIDAKTYDQIQLTNTVAEKTVVLNRLAQERNSTMAKNLFNLLQAKKPFIYICGAMHAPAIIDFFKKKKMDDKIIYYFPHSSKHYTNGFDDIQLLIDEGSPKEKFYLLSSAKEIELFITKILKDINIKKVEEDKRRPKELPKLIHIIDENKKLIKVYPILTRENQEAIYLLRSIVGFEIFKKMAFKPIYEISANWLKQVNELNSKGIAELTKFLDISIDDFRKEVGLDELTAARQLSR